jgi:hypothetical protein
MISKKSINYFNFNLKSKLKLISLNILSNLRYLSKNKNVKYIK